MDVGELVRKLFLRKEPATPHTNYTVKPFCPHEDVYEMIRECTIRRHDCNFAGASYKKCPLYQKYHKEHGKR